MPNKISATYFRRMIRTNLDLTVLGGAFGSLAIRFFIAGIGFATSIVLARLLGPSGLGAYVYATTIVGLLVIPATLGLPQLLIRETSRYDSENAPNKMHGLFKWAFLVSVPFACVLAGVAALVTWQLSPLITPDLTTIFLIAFLLVPIASIAKLSGAALQGLHHVLLGQIPSVVLNPTLFFALIVTAYLFFGPPMNSGSATPHT